MKQFKLKISNKLQVIGKIIFTFDKAFYRDEFDKTPKFVPARQSIFVYENETFESATKDILKNYRNARDFLVRKNGDQGGSL